MFLVYWSKEIIFDFVLFLRIPYFNVLKVYCDLMLYNESLFHSDFITELKWQSMVKRNRLSTLPGVVAYFCDWMSCFRDNWLFDMDFLEWNPILDTQCASKATGNHELLNSMHFEFLTLQQRLSSVQPVVHAAMHNVFCVQE